MINFRRLVCILLIVGIACFIGAHYQTILRPSGFFTALGAIFFTAVCVGLIWPAIPPERDSQDED